MNIQGAGKNTHLYSSNDSKIKTVKTKNDPTPKNDDVQFQNSNLEFGITPMSYT